jgi:hypothetical protein
MVRRRGSMVTRLQYTELADADWRPPCLPGLIEEDKKVTSELWNYTATLRVVSSDGERFGRS